MAVEEQVDVVAPDDLVVTHGPFWMTKRGIVASREATFEEWNEATDWAQQVEKSSPFWIGDLFAYGERVFGEKYAQAMDATHSSYGTLANAAYVARQVDFSRRRENLPFAIHQEVAPLPAADQEMWLQKASDQHLTREELRVQIRQAKATADHPVELWLLVKCGDVNDQNALADRLRLEGRAVKLSVRGAA